MLPSRLTAVDQITVRDHYYLEESDNVYFFGEYTPRQGFGYSATNQFIVNFKKDPSRRALPEWRYKEQAIQEFAAALTRAIKGEAIQNDLTFVPVPPSKEKSDPGYDNRMWRVLDKVKEEFPSADCRELILQTQTIQPFHSGTGVDRLRPADLATFYEPVVSGEPPRQIIVIVDDMLTTGCHFKAAEEALRGAWPSRYIVGVFAARRVPESTE